MMEDDYKKTSANQRIFLLSIAKKIKAGEILNDLEKDFAFVAIEKAAKGLPVIKPKPIGKPKIIEDRITLILEYATKLRCGTSQTQACNELAAQYGVTYEAIFKIIKEKKNKERIENAIKFLSTASIAR